MQNISTLAVLLTCHNRKDKTLLCLSSLFEAAQIENTILEVFLVDDKSADGTADGVKKYFPDVNVIEGTGELYWNRGMLLAWETARNHRAYDYYLWLNDDTFIYKDALEVILKNSREKEDACIICGTTESSDRSIYTYGGIENNGELIVPSEKLQECDLTNGNCLLIPRAVFEKVGMLDRVFTHAIGDYDYGLRAKKHNIKSFVASKTVGICDADTSLPEWNNPKIPLVKRIKSLYSPYERDNPYFYFLFMKRHYGFAAAIKKFIAVHIRVLLPQLKRRQIIITKD